MGRADKSWGEELKEELIFFAYYITYYDFIGA
jgi:hypothetical protein